MDLGDYSLSWIPNGEQSGIQVESAVVYPNSDIDTGYHWQDSTFGDDQFAQVVVAASAPDLFIGPAVRMDAGSLATYYGYYASSTARYLIKSVDGVITQLGSTTTSGVAATDVLRLEIIGNRLTPFKNGVKDTAVGAHTDTTLTTGSAGLAALGIGTGTSLSSWEAGMIGLAPENYSEFTSPPFDPPSGQMEALTQVNGMAPDAIAAATNLTGAVAAVQDDPDSPDGTWLTATSATAATDLRVSFATPAGPLTVDAIQNFRYLVRKTTGAPDPTLTAELREANVLRKTFATATPISSTTGTVIQGDWTDADVVATSGADVELRLVSSPGIAPTALQHFVKFDGTTRTAAAAAELTAYTITWANLTTAGFVAGDNALIIVGVKQWGSSAAGSNTFAVGFGTTYAGRTEDTTSIQIAEAPGTAAGEQYLWVKRRALVTNQNIYFRGQASTGTASYDEFVCFILNYDDIPTNDKLYAEATHSGNAPTTYGTAGAGVATPAAGDWWIVASSKWLVDGIAEDMFLAINDGTADVAEVSTESENATNERVIGTMAYRAGLGSGVTVRARYRETGATAPPDINATSIFGLRLNTFADYWGWHANNTVTHTALDTFQSVGNQPTYVLNNTGPFVVFGWPIHLTTEGTKRPYGRIQINNVDWLTATTNRSSIMDNGAAQRIAPLLFGYNPTQTAANIFVNLQAAEDSDINPSYASPEQIAVAFSLFRPGSATNTVEIGAIKWNASVDVAETITLAAVTGAVLAVGNAPAKSLQVLAQTGIASVVGNAPVKSVTLALAGVSGAVTVGGGVAQKGLQLQSVLGSAVIAGNVPSLAVLQTISLAPSTGVVAAAGLAPSLLLTNAPATGVVAATGLVPALLRTITPATGATTATGLAAVKSLALLSQPAAVSAVGVVPSRHTSIAAVSGAATIAGNAPALSVIQLVSVAPSTGVIAATGGTALLTFAKVAPSAGLAVFSGGAPAIGGTRTVSTGADASVILAGVGTVSTGADAAVRETLTVASVADAGVAVLRSASTSADALAAVAGLVTTGADVAALKLGIVRSVSADTYVFDDRPIVLVPADGCTIGTAAEIRTVTAAAMPRFVIQPAIIRSVVAPAIIPPEVP